MDIQDRIIIKRFFPEEKEEIIDLSTLKAGEILFRFNEYEEINIKLQSNKYSVSLECSSYISDKKYNICSENVLFLQSGKEYKISQHNNDDIGYRPDKYLIFIKNGADENEYYFEVRYNKEVSSDGMHNIIQKINNFISGLSIDFFKKQTINNISTNDASSDYYIYELLSSKEKEVSYNVNCLLGKLKTSIDSSFINEKVEKKQNLKTIKLNMQKSYKNKSYYNVKKTLNYNNPSNILLKKILFKILNIISNCDVNLNEIKNLKIKDLDSFNKEIDEVNLSKNCAHSNLNLSIIKNNLVSLEAEKKSCLKWIEKLNVWVKSYNNTKALISSLLNCDELIDINVNKDVTFSHSFIYDYNYKFFLDFYNDLTQTKSYDIKSKSKKIFTNKISYTIFEIYGFIIIQNIIKELGFELCYSEANDVFTFGSNKKYIYVKDDYTIEVLYDYYCKKRELSKIGDVVNINSGDCKPDFIVNVLDEKKQCIQSVIVEMKYRRLIYLATSQGTTETDTTLDNYYQLKYYASNGRKKYKEIDDVILIYPSSNERTFERSNATFVGINTEKDFSESDAYKNIKDILSRFYY